MKRFLALTLPILLMSHAGAGSTFRRSLIDDHKMFDHKKLDQVFSNFDKPDSPGGVMVVLQKGKTVYTKSFGFASLEHNVRNSPKTVFKINYGECREFTALTLALLAQEGKLSLDDSVRKYIPELPEFAAPITLRHMIHNASGLFDYGQQFLLTGWQLRSPLADADFFRLISRQTRTGLPAGSGFMYSNTDYALLTFVVERATGKSLRTQADRLLFRPLGMKSTLVDDAFGEVVQNRAYDYHDRGDKFFMVRREKTTPRNGILTTVEDLVRWAKAVNDPSSKVCQAALSLRDQAIVDPKNTTHFSYGHYLNRYRGIETISHQGVSSNPYLVRTTDGQTSFIYLGNGDHSSSKAIEMTMDEVLLGGPDRLVKSTRAPESQLNNWASIMKLNPNGVPITTEELTALAGGYSSLAKSLGRDFTCEVREGSLVEIFGDEVDRLIPLGHGVFSHLGYFIAFNPPNDGTPVRFKVFDQSGELVDEMEQMPLIPYPTSEQLVPLQGRYYNYELDVTWTIDLKNGKAILKRERMPDASLWPSASDKFALTVFTDPEAYSYDTEIRIKRSSGGAVTGFSIFSGRMLTGLEFKRIKDSQ